MLYERLHVTVVGAVATLVDSAVVAEFAGYWLRRLLQCDKFPALNRGHLIHHFLINGPRSTKGKRHRAFRSQSYRTTLSRYGLDETELLSLRCCSQALFHKEAVKKSCNLQT
jgi:hypothetical protein